MLAWTVYLSFIGVAWLLALKPDDARSARSVAMLMALAGLGIALGGALQYSAAAGLVTVVDKTWIPQLESATPAVDGISITLVR
jgi:NADH:ubiquinone oxidoreductase subunit 4 (subunit M)